ncbi:hypothetical protein CSC17_4440 [Klebsiella oxytoca]|nr:hypothetical protein CSC17_4440 [Klebsiella oxytoca]
MAIGFSLYSIESISVGQDFALCCKSPFMEYSESVGFNE